MSDHAPFDAADYLLEPGGARLRRTTQADADTLGPAITGIDPWARHGMSAERMTGFLAGSNETLRCFTIRRDSELAGVVAVRYPWLSGPYLTLLAVLPAYQGTGIGGAALAWMEGEALAAGARNCFLCVSAFNSAAHGFYLRNGYADAALLDELITDGEDEILMRKRLIQG